MAVTHKDFVDVTSGRAPVVPIARALTLVLTVAGGVGAAPPLTIALLSVHRPYQSMRPPEPGDVQAAANAAAVTR